MLLLTTANLLAVASNSEPIKKHFSCGGLSAYRKNRHISSHMKLSQKQTEFIVNKILKVHKGPRPCNVCGHTDWTVTDRVFRLQEYFINVSEQATTKDEQSVPLIPVSCKTCGNTLLLNALLFGLLTVENGVVSLSVLPVDPPILNSSAGQND